ncbi:MAG: hypothetical protein EZS28_028329, partial [Streblomastix strix]
GSTEAEGFEEFTGVVHDLVAETQKITGAAQKEVAAQEGKKIDTVKEGKDDLNDRKKRAKTIGKVVIGVALAVIILAFLVTYFNLEPQAPGLPSSFFKSDGKTPY